MSNIQMEEAKGDEPGAVRKDEKQFYEIDLMKADDETENGGDYAQHYGSSTSCFSSEYSSEEDEEEETSYEDVMGLDNETLHEVGSSVHRGISHSASGFRKRCTIYFGGFIAALTFLTILKYMGI